MRENQPYAIDHSDITQPPPLEKIPSRFSKSTFFALTLAVLAIATVLSFLLQKTSWNHLRIYLCLAAFAPLIWGWLADRYDSYLNKVLSTALLAVLALSATYLTNRYDANRLFEYKKVFAWNVFHYMLGSKYFDELGYFDFYNGLVLADNEGRRVFQKGKFTRDLRTNKLITIVESIMQSRRDGIRGRFSDERWQEFKDDLEAILVQRSANHWTAPIKDLGFNPSPAWLIVHRPLLNAVDIQNGRTLQILCALQLPLLSLTFAALWWAFGLRAALLCLLWFVLYFGNQNRMVGGYFNYDFLIFTVIAFALYHKKHYLAAGPVLAYAAMMRGFPGLLALPVVLSIVIALAKRQRPDRRHLVFVSSLVISCLLLVALGGTTARGPSAWNDWRKKITVHASHHAAGRARVGLGYLFAHNPERYGWTPSYSNRAKVLASSQARLRAVQALLLVLVLLSLIRRSDREGMIFSLAVVYFTMVLSRYYVSVWLLLFLWPALDRWRIANLASSLFMFGVLVVFYTMELKGCPVIMRYHIFVMELLVFIVALVIFFLTQDIRTIIRKRRLLAEP